MNAQPYRCHCDSSMMATPIAGSHVRHTTVGDFYRDGLQSASHGSSQTHRFPVREEGTNSPFASQVWIPVHLPKWSTCS
jgi:hypothetical protein